MMNASIEGITTLSLFTYRPSPGIMMLYTCLLSLVWLTLPSIGESFAPQTTRTINRGRQSADDFHRRGTTSLAAFPWLKFLPTISNNNNNQAKNTDTQRRLQLKQELIDLCQSGSTTTSRADVERLVNELSPLSPTKEPSTSNNLQKEWTLLWTTEKEINIFIQWNIATKVTQTIRGKDLGNTIAFKNGGSLAVSGALVPNSLNPLRTDFEFTTATLDLGWKVVPVLNIPPVGKGWFDTIYLDNDFRVDINSRDDLLVCRAGP